MSIDIAVVPVAGHGTRLLPATKSQPKEMLSVGRKPVVQYVVEELCLSGIRRLLFITSRGKHSIEQHFDIDDALTTYLRESGREEQLGDLDFERHEMEYFYTRQRRQLGLGHAILCARPIIGRQPFVVALGDTIIGMHAQTDIVARMTELFEAEGAAAVVAFQEVAPEDVVHYGVARPRKNERPVFPLDDVVEKPTQAEAPSNLAVAARYVFSPAIFDALEKTTPGKGGEIQLTDAIRLLLKEGGKVFGMTLAKDERRFDIGNYDSYFRTFIEFALSDRRLGGELRKFVREILDREES
jgi:UTP--glucose-1-phosphate uridylyltransferase